MMRPAQALIVSGNKRFMDPIDIINCKLKHNLVWAIGSRQLVTVWLPDAYFDDCEFRVEYSEL